MPNQIAEKRGSKQKVASLAGSLNFLHWFPPSVGPNGPLSLQLLKWQLARRLLVPLTRTGFAYNSLHELTVDTFINLNLTSLPPATSAGNELIGQLSQLI